MDVDVYRENFTNFAGMGIKSSRKQKKIKSKYFAPYAP